MMNEMYNVMNGGNVSGVVANNMWGITAFVAANNLIWYLYIHDDDFKIPDNIMDILKKVSDQIITLSHQRTAETSEKLQPSDFVKLREFIEEHKDKLGQ